MQVLKGYRYRPFWMVWFTACWTCWHALYGADVGNKHMLIVQADSHFIWGSYFIGVTGSEEQQVAEIPLLIPQETVDFQPGEGMQAEDIHLDAEGQVVFKKALGPENHLMGIGFKVPVGRFGVETMTLKVRMPIPELTIAAPVGFGLSFTADGFVAGLPPMLSRGSYVGIQSQGTLQPGQVIQVHVAGVPKAKHVFVLVALGFAVAVFGLGAAFALRTRPVVATKGRRCVT
ncbi:MAG: hypothetical protein OXT67_09560 [Zetaproteobacteria bacterium]|nr:hypothetical protein [Zetaproteobacteria bacterium]